MDTGWMADLLGWDGDGANADGIVIVFRELVVTFPNHGILHYCFPLSLNSQSSIPST